MDIVAASEPLVDLTKSSLAWHFHHPAVISVIKVTAARLSLVELEPSEVAARVPPIKEVDGIVVGRSEGGCTRCFNAARPEGEEPIAFNC